MANFLTNAVSNVFFKIRRNIFGVGVPGFTPPPVDKEQPGAIYEAPKKAQLEQWQATQPPTPTTAADQEEDQISFIPVSRGRMATPVVGEVGTEGLAPSATQEGVRRSSADHILLIAARPKSFVNLFLDELQKLGAEIPILKLIINKPRSREEMIAQAIERYISENPDKANTQEVQDLKANVPGISEEVVTITGQVKSLRFIPEEKVENERQRPIYQQQQEIYLPIQISPGRLIRFLPKDTFERLIAQRFGPGLSRITTSLGRDVLLRGSIAGRGLISGALRGIGGQAARFAAGMGARMAAIGTSWAWVPWVVGGALVLIVVGGGIFLLLGPITTRQAAFVGTGGAGNLLAQGNQYIAIEIIPSKTSLKNEELPQEIAFKINIKERKQSFTSGPNVTAVITAAGASGSRTLAQESWSGKTNEIKVTVGDDLEDVNLIVNVTAKASVSEQPNEQTAVNSTGVNVGSPPDDCPKIWPTPYGFISLGPNTSGTHASAEAVDIGNGGSQGAIKGAPIRSTTKGKVSYDCYSPLYGTCVRVTTQCQGKSVEIIYAHMLDGSRKVQEGQDITLGTVLGQVGSTGNTRCVPWPNCDASHLHYEFFKPGGQVTIRMSPPNIPTGSSW